MSSMEQKTEEDAEHKAKHEAAVKYGLSVMQEGFGMFFVSIL